MTVRAFLCAVSLATCVSCVSPETRPAGGEHVLLVPDWRNHVVHLISMDGGYEGDFLDARRFDDPAIERRAWEGPRGLIVLEAPVRFWITGERTLSQWDAAGRYERMVFADTKHLEEPAAIERVGDEVFVLSEDKKAMLVFDRQGALLRKFGAPYLDRAKDFAVGPDGLIYVAASLLSADSPGLVSVWDPRAGEDSAAAPIRYLVPPDLSDDGTFWAHSLVFDDDGNLLITEFSRGRVERWDPERNVKIAVLADSDQPGKYLELERGPDGLVYLAGSDGIYRFDSRAASLGQLVPFFDARTLADRYEKPFSPASLNFVPRAALADGSVAAKD